MTTRRDDPARLVASGMQALDEARAQGMLPPEEADRLAVEEVRAVRQARRSEPDPWTAQDPQPGDFDADLDGIDPRHVESHPGDPDAKVTIITAADDAAVDRR